MGEHRKLSHGMVGVVGLDVHKCFCGTRYGQRNGRLLPAQPSGLVRTNCHMLIEHLRNEILADLWQRDRNMAYVRRLSDGEHLLFLLQLLRQNPSVSR